MGKTNGVWNAQKLVSINEHWIKNDPPKEIAATLLPYLAQLGVEAKVDARLETAVKAFAPRAKTLVDMAQSIKPYYARGVTMDPAAAAKHLDAAGKVIHTATFNPKFVEREYLERFPGWSRVDVTTGWVTATVNGKPALDARIPTDPERFWDQYQSKVLPRIYDHVMKVTDNRPMPDKQPFHRDLDIDVQMSEPDFRIGVERTDPPRSSVPTAARATDAKSSARFTVS